MAPTLNAAIDALPRSRTAGMTVATFLRSGLAACSRWVRGGTPESSVLRCDADGPGVRPDFLIDVCAATATPPAASRSRRECCQLAPRHTFLPLNEGYPHLLLSTAHRCRSGVLAAEPYIYRGPDPHRAALRSLPITPRPPADSRRTGRWARTSPMSRPRRGRYEKGMAESFLGPRVDLIQHGARRIPLRAAPDGPLGLERSPKADEGSFATDEMTLGRLPATRRARPESLEHDSPSSDAPFTTSIRPWHFGRRIRPDPRIRAPLPTACDGRTLGHGKKKEKKDVTTKKRGWWETHSRMTNSSLPGRSRAVGP